jgi:uncharacterized protein (TIGR02271 family)
MNITRTQLGSIASAGGDVVGADGRKIGRIGQVYVDDSSGDPTFVTVKTGLFGTAESFVPLRNATVTGNDIRVAYNKDEVKDAPRIDPDGRLTPAEETELYAHYGLPSAGGYPSDTERTGRAGTRDYGTRGHDTSGRTTDDAMTRSEERLNVGTRKEEAGRARLRKYVVTENVTETVPVSREEVRVEREPITDKNVRAARSGPDISEEEHEVVLHEERPVVEKEAVPVERVRLDTETVTGEETVSEEVRKERIDTDLDTDLDKGRARRRSDR